MNYANTLKTAVACALLGAAAIASTASTAQAQPKFDKRIAKVLADKAAAALGALRLDAKAAPRPVSADTSFFGRTATDPMATGSIRAARPERTGAEPSDTIRFLMPRTDIRIVYAG